MSATLAVGIDLGTSKSSIAVWQNDRVEIIANDQGDRTSPSYVAFTKTDRLIGDVALHQIAVNPRNTVFDVKRFIGRKCNDRKLEEDMKFWAFQVIKTDPQIKIQVEHRGEVKRFTPEEISSMVLTMLKETAEAYLGTEVRDAVITVPAQFNDAQRQATINAGKIAGFNVLRIINESAAAAFAYGLNNNVKDERHILIFDLGAGTLDVSIVSVVQGFLFDVKASTGDPHLGGDDFDNRLTNYLLEECKRRFQQDLRTNPRVVRRVRHAAEKAKRTLSTSVEAIIELPGLVNDMDFYTIIARTRFERICADIFRAIMLPLEQAMIDTKMDRRSIDDVVLLGGCTKIPMIQYMLRKFFNGRSFEPCVIPNEAVAYGAAVQAAILAGDSSPRIQDLILVDITSISIGYETHGCVMTNLIERNTNRPCTKTQMFTTCVENQEVVPIQVYEGESVVTKFNNFLGTFKLNEIPPDIRGKPQIQVTFEVDANGILHVSAKEVRTKNIRDIVVTDDIGRFTEAEIEQMAAEAEMYRLQDQDRRDSAAARNYFQAFMIKTKQSALEAGAKISEEEKTILMNCCENGLKWLDEDILRGKEQCCNKLDEFKRLNCLTLTKMHASGDAFPTEENF